MLNFTSSYKVELSKLSGIKEPARAHDALSQAADILLSACERGEITGEKFEQVIADVDVIAARLAQLAKELR